MRAVVVATFGIAAFLAAGPALADDLTLKWRAPAGCPSGDQVRQAALKGAAKASKVEPLDAEASVESDRSDRWRVTLTTKRAGVSSSARRLEARSCEALADATAVILAMAMIPPGAAEEPPAPAPAPSPSPAPSPPSSSPSPDPASASASASAPAPASASASAPASASASAPASASASASADAPASASASPSPADSPEKSESSPLPSHALALAGGLTSDASTLPSAAIGGAAYFAWTPNRARVELSGSFYASQSKTTGLSPAGASLSLIAIGARGCYAIVKTNAIEISPCGGLELSNVSASGFGAAANYDASARWMSAAAGALVRVPFTSFLALRAQIDANVPFSRPTFVVDGEGAVHRPSAMGARGGIGLELSFL